MKRNSTTLFLVSPGATTLIPWVNNGPDFSAFTEPTLSVLQKAWQDFLDSGEELEIIPDPEPPPPAPDWTGFNLAMVGSSFTDWLSTFPEAYRVAAIQASANRNLEQLQSFYDLLVQTKKPLSSETAEWRSVADQFNVPMKF